ncbi:MAG: HTH domain-containing protein [Paenibacillus sp.]|uniref:effector binding domain-containing protein n=1 Tax=Paenibacillus sp. TaxID=58172 RepID=UPI0025F76330|nr:HTH domain-containing protein [Paenibacillus sp.]MBR2565332.1 HTH domain-containing protein [Paenibacillus sp.]
MTKTERLIELMMRVYEKPRFTAEEMAAEFGVSYRTMLRYLHELSGMGVPLYAEPGRSGGYSLLLPLRHENKMTAQRMVRRDPFQRIVRPETYVVGLEFQAPFTAVFMAQVMIPRLWAALKRRQHEIPRQKQAGVRTGVVLSRQRLYHYIAGVEVFYYDELPEDMIGITLPAREYAQYTHQGKVDRIQSDESFLWMMDKLKLRGLMPDLAAYALEIQVENSPNIDMYVPLCHETSSFPG